MKQNYKERIIFLFLRYVLILLVTLAFFFWNFFYNFLFYITIYPINFLINLFYISSIEGDILLIENIAIKIIPACVASSAFYLLFMLNLITPMNLKKRIFSIISSLILLWIFNIGRIFIFSILFINDYIYFDTLHKFFWFVVSTLLVGLIWFLTAHIFKIRAIPVYRDIKFLKEIISKESKE